jgi:NAD(P)-dependent dehydrogenase (short-subunit alcohol dehydrogenase family)
MRGLFADLSNETVRAMVDANFLSAVWTTRAALPALRESQGRVLFVSSLAGLRGFPGVSLYSASKMALTALCQSLQAEEGPHGVGFSLSFLAFTENDPEKTVLSAAGRPFRHQRPWSLTQSQAASALLEILVRRRKTSVLTAQGRLLAWTQGWFPGLVDQFVKGSGGTIHHVEEKTP